MGLSAQLRDGRVRPALGDPPRRRPRLAPVRPDRLHARAVAPVRRLDRRARLERLRDRTRLPSPGSIARTRLGLRAGRLEHALPRVGHHGHHRGRRLLPRKHVRLGGRLPVAGASGTVALLFRGPSSDQSVLFAPSGDGVVPLRRCPRIPAGSASSPRGTAIPSSPDPGRGLPDVVSAVQSDALPMWRVPSLVRFGVAEVGTGFVAFALSSNGTTRIIDRCAVVPSPGPLHDDQQPEPGPKACTFGGLGCTLASVLLGGLLAALVLAGIVEFFRGRRRRSALPVRPEQPGGFP